MRWWRRTGCTLGCQMRFLGFGEWVPRLLITLGDIVARCANDHGKSQETVKRHLSNIFDKLGVFSRLELAIFALNHGLIEDDGDAE